MTAARRFLAAMLFLSYAVPSEAQTNSQIRVCFLVTSQYEDSHPNHDAWTSTATLARTARGIRARIKIDGGATLFDTYTGDGTGSNPIGCTSILETGTTTPQAFDITVWSSSKVNGNFVRARDVDWNLQSLYVDNVQIPKGVASNVTMDASGDHRFNIMMAGSFAGLADNLGFSSYNINFIADHSSGATSRFNNEDPVLGPYLEMAQIHWNNKFIIAHEMGHLVAWVGTGEDATGIVDTNCGYSTGTGVCDSSSQSQSHHMGSKEHNQCAAGEGWANFFAAKTWNTWNDQNDCWFTLPDIFQTQVDCENANTGWPTRFHHTTCPSPHTGKGVELDWLRTFWDLHTNPNPEISLATMLAWLDVYGAWDENSAYAALDSAANSMGTVFEANWNTAKCLNGIYPVAAYPPSECP